MSGRVVVDAGLAVKWVLPEPNRPQAIDLLMRWERSGVRRLVPGVFAAEVAAVLYQLVQDRTIAVADATSALTAVLAAVNLQPDTPALAARSVEIAAQLGLPRPFAAHYLALAEHNDCELWTADARFQLAARDAFPLIHRLDDPPAPGGER